MEEGKIMVSIRGRNFPIRVFSVGAAKEEDIISPGLMATGGIDEIRGLYADLPLLKCGENELMYIFLSSEFGDFTTVQGQEQLANSKVVLVEKAFNPPSWAAELHHFAALKSNKNFKVDNEMVCLRNLVVANGSGAFYLGSGFYSKSFFSNGSAGMNISLTAEEKEKLSRVLPTEKFHELVALSARLESLYGKNITMREL